MKTKKKNLVIIYENYLYGGTSTHLINLINSSHFKSFNISIITNKNNQSISQLKKNTKNLKLIYFNSLNVIFFKNVVFKILFFLFKPLLFLLSILQFYLILKKVKYETLLANCGGYGDFRSEIAAILSSRLIGVKKIFLLIHHEYRAPKFWKILIKFFDTIVSRYLKKIIFVSYATKKSILRNSGLNILPNRSQVIHNGVLIKKKLIKIKKISQIKKKEKIIIGMMSRIEEYKGQEDLLKSILLLNRKYKEKIKVLIIGNGEKSYVSKIKNFIRDNKLKKIVTLKKYLDKDVSLIMKNFNIFISLTRTFEGFGYSLAEAMSFSIPVITTNVGGSKEFLNNKNSNIVKPRDPVGVSVMIKDYFNNKRGWEKKAYKG